jgi:ArsR family transcriptional regulator
MVIDVRPVADLLKVLGEPVRWRIVERLAAEELCVCHLVEDLDLAQPLVSHHLRVLREAGVVTSERYRQWVYYRLVPDALAVAADALAGVVAGAGSSGARRRPCC